MLYLFLYLVHNLIVDNATNKSFAVDLFKSVAITFNCENAISTIASDAGKLMRIMAMVEKTFKLICAFQLT